MVLPQSRHPRELGLHGRLEAFGPSQSSLFMDPERLGQSLSLTFPGQANHMDESWIPFQHGLTRMAAQGWECSLNSIFSTPESATCAVSGDPHYLTFDGALHHFMGTCAYILTQPCQPTPLENFTVSTTSEFRSGNLEASYVRAVNVQVFNLKISLIKGYKVMVCASAHLSGPPTPSLLRVCLSPSFWGS